MLFGAFAGEEIFLAQRRKGAKKALETRQRFAPLHLCARDLVGIDVLSGKADPYHSLNKRCRHERLWSHIASDCAGPC